MWEDWGRDGQIKTVCDMCRVCPTAGRSAYRSCQDLITAKMWHSCSRLNCIVSAHVALIAQLSIYAFCPFAARYFFRSVCSRLPTTAGCAADLYQRTILFCGFVLILFCAARRCLSMVAVMRRPGRCTCGVVWHSGGDINSRPSIQLINKISTVVKYVE